MHIKNLFFCQTLYLESKQYPFRFIINLDCSFGGPHPYEEWKFSFIYATQCVSFDGCKVTVPVSDSNGLSCWKLPISFKENDERSW